jgi:mRNA-degrading endonuclease RelE of RelBE toxin-antitoxin system
MSYRIEFTGAARKDIERLPTGVAWAVVEFCEGPLAENPYRVGKPLTRELAGLYSARRGSYRIVYAIHEDEVVVEVVYIRGRPPAYGGR